jgi:hypothetical protein
MRRTGHPAFARLAAHFPAVDLHDVAEKAWAAKKAAGLGGGGGDPDLFVYHPGGAEKFFVEVKDEDDLHASQLICFPILERELDAEVRLIRIVPRRETEP